MARPGQRRARPRDPATRGRNTAQAPPAGAQAADDQHPVPGCDSRAGGVAGVVGYRRRRAPCQPGGTPLGQPSPGPAGAIGACTGGAARTVAGGRGLQRAAAAPGRDAGRATAFRQQCRASAAHAVGGNAGGTGEFIAPA
ncbi:hypothetical protein G6F62_014657 [Rhizopus arrhizus]|nr:hypothetical protein G6F62_014657 [Rhizopus arrhizus]